MSLVSLLIIWNLNITIIIALNFWIIAIIYIYIFQGIYLTSWLIVSYFRRGKLHTSLNTCRQKVNKTETVNSSLQTQSFMCNNIMSLQKPLCLIPTVCQPCVLLTCCMATSTALSLPAYGTESEAPPRLSCSPSPSLSLHGFWMWVWM